MKVNKETVNKVREDVKRVISTYYKISGNTMDDEQEKIIECLLSHCPRIFDYTLLDGVVDAMKEFGEWKSKNK